MMYKIHTFRTDHLPTSDDLLVLGNQGWRLVQVIPQPHGDGYITYMERTIEPWSGRSSR